MRTADPQLATAIREVSNGILSEETARFLSSRTAPLPVKEGAKLVLFGERADVQLHNNDCLSSHPGASKLYRSQDTGSNSELNHMSAEKVGVSLEFSVHTRKVDTKITNRSCNIWLRG